MAKDSHNSDKKKQKKQKAPKQSGKGAWKVLDKGSGIAAGMIAARLSAFTWRAATGKKPPAVTQHPDLRTAEAVTWAALAGATVELSKVLMKRKAASYWVESTGHLPPGMKSLDDMEKAGRNGRKK